MVADSTPNRLRLLVLLGLRIFEATSVNIADLGEEHGHRVLRVCGKGTKVSRSRCHPRSAGPSTGQPTTGTRARSCSTVAAPGWTAMQLPGVCGGSLAPPACGRR
jgi:hypothetical protein